MKISLYLLLLSGLSILITGCGPKLPPGMPRLVPCELTVIQGDAPMVGATVVLIPETGNSQWNMVGMTNESGVTPILTDGEYKGAPEGKYKIIVTKIESEQEDATGIPKPGEPGYTESLSVLGGRAPIKRYLLIERDFTNPATTPLTIEISGRKITQKIDVGSFVRDPM